MGDLGKESVRSSNIKEQACYVTYVTVQISVHSGYCKKHEEP